MDLNIKKINDKLKFNTVTELEKYRADSIFDKEPETIEWIKFWSNKTSGIFYDIGANIGIYSLYAAHLGGVEVYSFEPVQNNFSQLISNIELNQFENIYPFKIALSNESKLQKLKINDLRVGNSGAQLSSSDVISNQQILKQEKVLTLSLDMMINQLGFPTPNFIKIDVDGIESLILRGMEKTLDDINFKSILVELENEEEFNKNAEYLKKFGFKIDQSFDDIENHSTIRRKAKESTLRNYIFTK